MKMALRLQLLLHVTIFKSTYNSPVFSILPYKPTLRRGPLWKGTIFHFFFLHFTKLVPKLASVALQVSCLPENTGAQCLYLITISNYTMNSIKGCHGNEKYNCPRGYWHRKGGLAVCFAGACWIRIKS